MSKSEKCSRFRYYAQTLCVAVAGFVAGASLGISACVVSGDNAPDSILAGALMGGFAGAGSAVYRFWSRGSDAKEKFSFLANMMGAAFCPGFLGPALVQAIASKGVAPELRVGGTPLGGGIISVAGGIGYCIGNTLFPSAKRPARRASLSGPFL